MDIYCEQLVEKKRSSGDTAKIVLTLTLSIILGSALILFALLSGLWVLIIGGVVLIVFGAWLAAGFNVEYEYIVTNSEMDIDKITGKRKRKRMITVDLSKATEYAPLPCENEGDAEVTVQASTGMQENAHFLICTHSDYGTVKIIFNPDERTREAIGQSLPRALRRKVNENG